MQSKKKSHDEIGRSVMSQGQQEKGAGDANLLGPVESTGALCQAVASSGPAVDGTQGRWEG